MALFSRNKNQTPEPAKAEAQKAPATSTALPTDRNLESVLQAPRITEKSVGLGEQNVYTFVVHPKATKYQIKAAVAQQFGVTPVKVNIVNQSSRKKLSRYTGRTTHVAGTKKAYVYLKKGDSISLV